MIAMSMIGSLIAAPHQSELIEMQQNDGTMEERFQAVQQLMASEGGNIPVWLLAAMMFSCVSMLAWPTAVVLGILALYRSSRKNLAVIALVICGLFFIMNLAQFL